MATGSRDNILSPLRQAALRRDGGGLTDGELMERFLSQRDEAAFEGLLRRHGPMVLAVCRRILRNNADAEDAFQATILVLLRKAPSIDPPEAVGNFLYGVAYRIAQRARAANAKRRVKEKEAQSMVRPEASEEIDEHLLALLDRELHGLPDKYRTPIVLCELEGKTRKEAARLLGWAEGTVASRLARGRTMLARRLARHGLTLPAAALSAALTKQAASASLSVSLVGSTIKAVTGVAAGEAAATVFSAKAAALAEGVVKSMLLTKLKWAGASALMVVVLGAAVGGAVYRGQAVETDKPKAPAKKTEESGKAKAPRPHPKVAVQPAQVLNDALDAARNLKDKQWKAWMLTSIAEEQAKAGDKTAAARTYKEALDAAEEMEAPEKGSNKNATIAQILGSQARTGDIEAARKIAATLEFAVVQDEAMGAIAWAQAQVGDVEGGLKTAETIGTDFYKGSVLALVVKVHAKAGRFKKAVDLTETIADDYSRARARFAIAEVQAKAKDHAAARKNLQKALDIAHEIEEGGGEPLQIGSTVAQIQTEMGEIEKALKTANAIKDATRKSFALRDIAVVRAKAGDLKGARKIADTISEEHHKGEALQEIVTVHLSAGDPKAATEIAESIESVACRIESLLEIAKFRARKEGRAAADKIFQKVFQEAKNVRDEEPQMGNLRNAVLSHIVQAQAETGAEKEALAWAVKQDSALLKTQALLGIAKGLAQRQQTQKRPRE
ncbi:MAG TPA: sigma-70 family RNA polymerase sigma factor [Gemmataceae bacterium]